MTWRQRGFSGIVFDVGDIFFDASPWRRWLANRITQFGAPTTYPELVQRWERLLVDVYCGRSEYWIRFDRLLRDYGLTSEHVRQLTVEAKDQGAIVATRRKLFEGVAETLHELHSRNVKLAALSDTETSAAGVRQRLANLGVERYLDAVICSVDIGYAKPAREAFNAVLAALNEPVEDCAFVGHDVDELEGAKAAGLYAIAFNAAADAPADLHVERFTDLLTLTTAFSRSLPSDVQNK